MAKLRREGFPVPEAFIVSASAYREFTAGCAACDAASMGEALAGQELPIAPKTEIRRLLETAGPGPYAVRSSSTLEDLADSAFAGQHETYLNVRGTDAVLRRVRDCFLSLWGERAVSYRGQRGYDHRHASMAVVIQHMIPCEAAGVAFSLDPVSGDAGKILIDANRGLGESVVSGESAVDHWVLNRERLEILEARIADKTLQTIGDKEGIRHVTVTGDQATLPSLSDQQLRAVARLVLDVEAKAAFPQDIEWGFASGKLWLLQARAITTLPERWTRNESAERFPGPITPLTWEFVEAGFHDSLAWSLRLMGMPPCPGRWFASFDHYIYGNQNLVERYCRLPFEVGSLDDLEALVPRLRDDFRWVQQLPVDWMRDLDGYLIGIGRASATDLAALDDRELWQHAKDLVRHGSDYFRPNIAISITHGLLCQLLHKLVSFVAPGEEAVGLFQSLLAWGNTKTSQINRELQELAAMQREDGALRAALAKGKTDLAEFTAFQQRFAKFLTDHGHRETDFDMYHAPWGDAPWTVLDHLRAMADHPPAALDGERLAKLAAHKAEQHFLQLAPESWRFFFSEVLRLARVYTQLDDLEHYHTTRLNRPIRRALAALGQRLRERGILEEDLDLFFAKTSQIDALLAAESITECEAFTLAVRQDKQAYLSALDREPAWTPGGDEPVEELDDGPLKGLPGSPGIAEGLIHHVRGPEDFAAFPPGAVLVSRTTNPAWTPLFHLAAAVITESGGPLSHGAVTARELGIPAVMSVPGCLSRLPQGSRVKVDGLRGLVTAR